MSLKQALHTYHRKLLELQADEGKFVVLHGEEVAGTFASAEDPSRPVMKRTSSSPSW